MEDELDNATDDLEIDRVFDNLKQELEIKHSAKNDGEESSGYACKVCGTHVNHESIKKCVHCGLSTCKKCSTYGFCLHCWVNMNEDPRKTLKLTRALVYMLPILTIFVLMQGYQWYLVSQLVLIGSTLLMYFYTKNHIIKHPNRYFSQEWENEINTKEFHSFLNLNPTDNQRYIPNELYRELDKKKARSVAKLENWIESMTGFSDTPQPYVENQEKLPDSYKAGRNANNSFRVKESTTDRKDRSKSNLKYNLIGRSCPQCGKIIHFADFCPYCNIKYCPKCKMANNPYTKTCICGWIFPDLEEEYFIWTGNREIEYIDKELGMN